MLSHMPPLLLVIAEEYTLPHSQVLSDFGALARVTRNLEADRVVCQSEGRFAFRSH